MNLSLKSLVAIFPRSYSGHRIIDNPNHKKLKERYFSTWKDEKIPQRQLKITNKQLPEIEKVPAIANLIEFIKATKIKNPTILEIGCSTGYHVEAFRKVGLKVSYQGCDYSPEFIKIAREKYPGVDFKVDDATDLHYQSNSFDIVVSGCCILHIIDYQKAIKEAARVAKKFVVFHRTPIIHIRPTTYTKKIGYGVEMIEIIFNEEELVNLFRKNNLIIESVNTHAQFNIPNLFEPVFMKNYLCQKIS